MCCRWCCYECVAAGVAMNVLQMVVDALLLCFCEDCQMNDGSPGKEYSMSSSLMVRIYLHPIICTLPLIDYTGDHHNYIAL